MKTTKLLTWSLLVLFLASCTKQELSVTKETPQETQILESRIASREAVFAYVFIEPQSKNVVVSNAMKTVNPALLGFRGFNNGIGISTTNRNDLLGYMNLNLWTNGTLPAIRSVEIPTSTGGIDSFALGVYTPTSGKFKKIRITKSEINETAWIMVAVPSTYATSNTLSFCAVKNNRIVSSGTNTPTTFTMNQLIYSNTFNYTGNKIPVGSYKIYTTYTSPHMRVSFPNFDYIEIRGL